MNLLKDLAYTSWLSKEGILLSPSLAIHFDSEKGFHMIATSSISIGTKLVTVPHTSCSMLNSKKAYYTSVEKALLKLKLPSLYIQASQLLVLLFGSKKLNNKFGEHGTLLKKLNLETVKTHSSSFSSTSINVLRGTSLENDINLPIQERFEKEIWPRISFLLEKKKYNEAEEKFLFCVKLVLSRCVETNEADGLNIYASGPQFVPVIDFFNHSSSPNAQIGTDIENFTCVSISNIDKGEQVFISYGEKSDAELLKQYGFVLRPLTISSIEKDKVIHQKKLYEKGLFNLLSEDEKFVSIFASYFNPQNTVFISAENLFNILEGLVDQNFTPPLCVKPLFDKKNVKKGQYEAAKNLCKLSGLYFEGGGFTCLDGNVSYDLILVTEILLCSLLFPTHPLLVPNEASSCPTIKKTDKKRKIDEVDTLEIDKKISFKKLASWDVFDKTNINKTVWLSLFVIFASILNSKRKEKGKVEEGKQTSVQVLEEFCSTYFTVCNSYIVPTEESELLNCLWIALGEETILIKFMVVINRNLDLGLQYTTPLYRKKLLEAL
jgi:hypothetical protein